MVKINKALNIMSLVLTLAMGIYGIMLFVSSICSAASYPQESVTPLAVDLSMNQYKLKDVGDIITKGPWIDVRAFGAVGDGITDDTTAIQNAVNAGGIIFFPAGTYKVTSTITIPVGDVQTFLQGEGGLSTTIRFTATNGSHLFSIPGTITNRAYFWVKDMYLMGNASSGGCIDGSWLTADGFRLIRTRIQDFGGNGVNLSNSFGAVIDEGCYIGECNQSSGTAAVYMYLCSGAKVGGLVKGNKKKGIYFDNCSSTFVTCVMEQNNDDFLTYYSCRSGKVTAHFETGQPDPPRLIVITGPNKSGASLGQDISGCGMSRASDTTGTATKSPIYIDYGMGTHIHGNNIHPSSVSTVPHVYITGNAEDITIDRNLFQGNRQLSPSIPMIYIAPGAKNIQCSFLVRKSYTYYAADVVQGAAGASCATGYYGTDRLGTGYVMPRKSWIVGIDVIADEAVTAGACTVKVYGSSLQAVLDDSYTTKRYVEQHPFQESLAENNIMLCEYTTTANYTPTGSQDLVIVVHVLEEREG